MSRLDALHVKMIARGISASLYPRSAEYSRHIGVRLLSGLTIRIRPFANERWAINDQEPVKGDDTIIGLVMSCDPVTMTPYDTARGEAVLQRAGRARLAPLGFKLHAIHTTHSLPRLGIIKDAEVPGLDTTRLWDDPLAARDHARAVAEEYARSIGSGPPTRQMSATFPTGLGFDLPSDVLILLERVYPDPWA